MLKNVLIVCTHPEKFWKSQQTLILVSVINCIFDTHNPKESPGRMSFCEINWLHFCL